MTPAKQSIVRVLKPSAGVGAWAGGVYGLLVASWSPWVFDESAMPATVSSPLFAFVLGCVGGVVAGAVTGAIVGAVMGFGIYDFLIHEQSAREVDRLFMKGTTRNTIGAGSSPFAGTRTAPKGDGSKAGDGHSKGTNRIWPAGIA